VLLLHLVRRSVGGRFLANPSISSEPNAISDGYQYCQCANWTMGFRFSLVQYEQSASSLSDNRDCHCVVKSILRTVKNIVRSRVRTIV